jgi:uncharacterized protein YjiS (DUF1127 family)
MIKSIKTRLAAWNQQRETIRELSMLTNRELADLGIGRGDIPFVADGSLLVTGDVAAPVTADDALIGPAWAAHVPTSLAA